MKFVLTAFFFLALLAAVAFATDPPTDQVIVSYPKGTPPSVLEQAKKAVLDAGGVLIYEYTLITGFAAKVPTKIVEEIRTLGAEHNVLVEQDSTVSINGGS